MQTLITLNHLLIKPNGCKILYGINNQNILKEKLYMEGNKKIFYQIKIVQISFALFFAAALSILFYFIMDNAGDRTISFGKFISAIRPYIRSDYCLLTCTIV